MICVEEILVRLLLLQHQDSVNKARLKRICLLHREVTTTMHCCCRYLLLVEACEKAMAKNPEERFSSASISRTHRAMVRWFAPASPSLRIAQPRQKPGTPKTHPTSNRSLEKKAAQGLSNIPIWENEESKALVDERRTSPKK